MADRDVVASYLKGFDQDRKPHDLFVRKVDERYRAYRGVLERRSEAASWTNKQHPPYILQIIETMVANLLDPSPRWKLRARPRMASPEEIDRYVKGAKAMELLLNYQLDLDHFAEKQRAFSLQALVTGLSVAKTYWREEYAVKSRYQMTDTELLHPETGEGLGVTVPQARDVVGTELVYDDPTTEICDVRDWIWHEAAVSLEKAMRVTHRVWYTFDELKTLEAQGVYQNVDELKESQNFASGMADREQDLFQVSRTKDMIEVLECWKRDKDGITVATIANRKVLLSKPKANPFNHGQFPFVIVSSMPDLFRIPGLSEVEVVQELQEMLWTLMNQRLDNVQLLNNAVYVVQSSVDDPESFEFAPGERWIVDGDPKTSVMQLPVDATVSTISMSAESGIKSDLQNITGGMPMMSGTDSAQIDNQTATGVSIFTSLAQRRLAAKKQNFTWAYKRIGEQRMELNQQFIRSEQVIQVVGPDGEPFLKTISPLEIQGRFHIEATPMDESLMRQERRAEAQAKLQVALSAVPVFAALSSVPGSTTPSLNLQAYMDDYLDAFDVPDKGRYYSAAPQPPAGLSSQQGQPGAAPLGAEAGGVTAPQANDTNSPSNVISQSPAQFMARAGAMTGGPVNQ